MQSVLEYDYAGYNAEARHDLQFHAGEKADSRTNCPAMDAAKGIQLARSGLEQLDLISTARLRGT